MPGTVILRDRVRWGSALFATLVLAACGSDVTPAAFSMTVAEDSVLAAALPGYHLFGHRTRLAVTRNPSHGTIETDAELGQFTYRPLPDFYGTDQFVYEASGGPGGSAPVTITLVVTPVNDPPVPPPLSDITNSPETLETFIALPERDVDGDLLQYAVEVSNPFVAEARVGSTGMLIVRPRARGETVVSVRAADQVSAVTVSFRFTVTEVAKTRRWSVADPQMQAIRIANTSTSDVTFELKHNGARIATSGEQMLQDVREGADERPAEEFERKLWRYLRDNVYHYAPITEAVWIHDPLLLVNSIGFGFCDDVASAYVSLARQADYPARAWGLSGHVVPEVQVGGSWSLYDPDLSVYYEDDAGHVVGAAELFVNPALITAPRNPLTPSYGSWTGYSGQVADVYSTVGDNHEWWEFTFVPPRATGDLTLPAGATVTYPGRWTDPPSVYDGLPSPSVYAELRMDVPANFAGTVDWPLVLWAVEGPGRVSVGTRVYDAGSAELTAALRQRTAPLGGVEILQANGPLTLIWLLNPMRFNLGSSPELSLRSLNAWALSVDLVPLDENARLLFTSTDGVAKAR